MSVLSADAGAVFQRWNLPQVDADRAVIAARENAARPTVSDLEALERQAREEGFAAGHAQGLAYATVQVTDRLARLDALYVSAAQPLRSLDEITELELTRLALTVARRVIAHELSTSPDLVVHAIRQAATALPSATRELRVRLHPADLALMRELGAAESHWQLVSDAALTRGDCRLESEKSRLDARLETRLAALIDAVLGDDAGEGDAEVSP